ncbi:prepilin peptidase [Shewanella psychrophila]|uniref:prepilin peptidase n=1 Tax=Shewanella psychrophila TaxID=225848 RepID=UPI000989C05A
MVIAMVASCLISFFQLLFYRMKSGFNLFDALFTPSHCENCQSKINVFFLIPIFGFFISKGKCRHCNLSIPLKYIMAELFVFIISFCASIKFIDLCLFGIDCTL